MYIVHYNIQWLEEEFLDYLDEWDTEVKGRPGFTDCEEKMTLSQETLEGLRMTGTCTCMYVQCV